MTANKEAIDKLRLEYLTIKNDMLDFNLSDTSQSILYDRIEVIRRELSKLGANAR